MLKYYHTGGGSSTSVLGGLISSAEVAEVEERIFPNLTQQQATDGKTQYACICIKNTGSNLANVQVYFSSLVSESDIRLAKGSTGKNSTTEPTIADQDTAPTGDLVWMQPVFDYEAVMIGNLDTDEFFHIWFRRETLANTPGNEQDYFIVSAIHG